MSDDCSSASTGVLDTNSVGGISSGDALLATNFKSNLTVHRISIRHASSIMSLQIAAYTPSILGRPLSRTPRRHLITSNTSLHPYSAIILIRANQQPTVFIHVRDNQRTFCAPHVFFSLPLVSVQHDAVTIDSIDTTTYGSDRSPEALRSTPETAYTTWFRMLGSLGNINQIQSAEQHHRIMRTLFELWEILCRVRASQT